MPQRPDTTFPKPQWDLLPDSRARWYANVDNNIKRYLDEAYARHKLCPVEVPTALFTLMKETLAVEPTEEVQLYIVPQGEYFVFGMAWGERDINVADLWYYTEATLPVFLR